jgi:hypothetical protein
MPSARPGWRGNTSWNRSLDLKTKPVVKRIIAVFIIENAGVKQLVKLFCHPLYYRGRDMDELVKLVMQKTGLAEGTAKITLQVIIGYLKDRLPGPVADQIETILGSSEAWGQTSKQWRDSGRFPLKG